MNAYARTAFGLIFFLAFAAGVRAAEAPLVLGDFEDGAAKPFVLKNGVEVVAEHAAHGAKALKVPASQWLHADESSGLPRDWTKYDLVRFECFNPDAKNVRMTVQIRDPMDGKGYWAWHNRYVALAPGANSVQFAVADLWRGEVSRNDISGMLDPKNITGINITADGAFVIDLFRLEAFPAAKVEVPGLKAFKVGPAKSPGFPGFTKVSEKDAYNKEKGFGWLKSDFARLEDRLHPDNLFRSYISCRNAELAVDLPNGKYRVHLQLEDPGYWEFMQHYGQRQVAAEGKTVIDEKMDAAEFKKRYYRNQDAEDVPGEDPFEKYVEPRFPWHTFEVEVADGQLNLDLRSQDTYGNTLSAIVIYPADQADKGAQFLAYVKEIRRFDWSQRWKPVSKAPEEPKFSGVVADQAAKDGFVLYVFPVSQGGINYGLSDYSHVPQETELIANLSATAAQGEGVPLSFGLRPAKPLGKVEVSISALKSDQGAEMPAGSISVSVGRYRFSRYQNPMSGLYNINERELRRFNTCDADTLRADNGMARRFWISIQVSADAAPGDYSGAITVKAEKGGTRALPLRLTVLPYKLPEPGHLFSLYGIDLMPQDYYPEMKAEREARIEALYRDLRAHGINYIKELSVQAAWENGKAAVKNAAGVDREIALRKKLGFSSGPVDGPTGCSLEDLATNGKIKGASREQFITGWHKELTDVYAARGWPKPFFCYGDEPNIPETLNKLTAANKAVHTVSADYWMGIAYHVESPESYALLESLDVHHLKDFCKDEDFKKAKQAGKFLLNCNVGDNRAAYGLRAWRSMKVRGTDGLITYAYTGNHVDIYYDLDAREGDYMMAPPRADGTFATTARWERIRQGIDDFRHARALEALSKDVGAAQDLKTSADKLLARALEIGAEKNVGEAIRQAETWRAEAQQALTKAAAK